MIIPEVYRENELREQEVRDSVSIRRMEGDEFLQPAVIKEHLLRLRPEIVVGATIYGSFALARADPQVPFWADQFGHVMAEAQAKAALEGENWPLPHWWKMVEPVMRRADKISTVSERQRFAAIGELGALGRLSAETCGYEFTAVCPCALMPQGFINQSTAFRDREIPATDCVVLWSGGYNTWSDVETLFGGLERAMDREGRIQFVSTGGEITGHDSETYSRFKSLVRDSEHRDRFHLHGWIAAELVGSYVAESDLGILTEKRIYEGLLGSKNRVVQWLAQGLPVLYNRMGDLGDYLADQRLGLVFEPGDASALADRIVWAVQNREHLAEMRDRARMAAQRDLSFEATTDELRQWVEEPSFAPDRPDRAKIASPLDHGGAQDHLSAAAQNITAVRDSRLLRAVWRRFFARE